MWPPGGQLWPPGGHSLDFHQAPWSQIRERLSKVEWNDLEKAAKTDIDEALNIYHSRVLEILEDLVPAKKPILEKYRMPKLRKQVTSSG